MPHETNKLDEAKKLLLEELSDGLKHGFFEYTIIGQIVPGGKRQLIIKAGKSHQFIINQDELK